MESPPACICQHVTDSGPECSGGGGGFRRHSAVALFHSLAKAHPGPGPGARARTVAAGRGFPVGNLSHSDGPAGSGSLPTAPDH